MNPVLETLLTLPAYVDAPRQPEGSVIIKPEGPSDWNMVHLLVHGGMVL